MDKQELRNALSIIEDRASMLRKVAKMRTTAVVPGDVVALTELVRQLTFLVRQEIVK